MRMTFKHVHHVNRETIDRMYETYTPVFILSTGRSGSKFIANLLDYSANVSAYHEPRPTLQYFSNYAFHNQQQEELLRRMIDGARMEMILEVFIKDSIYVESNQCLTFFAPVLAKLFKSAKFVHLVRHPGDFVRSAVRKGWHRNDSIWEVGRVKMADEKKWLQMDQIEKLGWVWLTSHSFIENFKTLLDSRRVHTCTFEEVVERVDAVMELLKFIGAAAIGRGKIKKLQEQRLNPPMIQPDEPANMKKAADFPPYDEWPHELKAKLKRFSEGLANRYGYKL